MEEQGKEQQQQQVPEAIPSEPAYPHLNVGEDPGEILGFAGPFKGAAGFVEVHLFYWVHARGVLLAAVIHPPGSPRVMWRRHWVSHIEAVRAAANLASEAEDYLRQITKGQPMREVEDLDWDDYVDHLMTRINKEFH